MKRIFFEIFLQQKVADNQSSWESDYDRNADCGVHKPTRLHCSSLLANYAIRVTSVLCDVLHFSGDIFIVLSEEMDIVYR